MTNWPEAQRPSMQKRTGAAACHAGPAVVGSKASVAPRGASRRVADLDGPTAALSASAGLMARPWPWTARRSDRCAALSGRERHGHGPVPGPCAYARCMGSARRGGSAPTCASTTTRPRPLRGGSRMSVGGSHRSPERRRWVSKTCWVETLAR